MAKSSLLSMLKALEYGTNLKIGVVFFGARRTEQLLLPHEYSIHTGAYCWKLKESKAMASRCLKCRNIAFRKALNTGKSFFGYCINGVLEYTHPVIIQGKTVAIIFIGNILDRSKTDLILQCIKSNGYESQKDMLLSSFEQNASEESCRVTAELIEDYITMVLTLHPADLENRDQNTVVNDIQNFVEENLYEDISIKSIASFFHYNEKYLGRLFKKNFNLSIKKYICKKRIEKACELLAETEFSITEIAARCGFENVTYFNRRFREFTQTTPSSYRREQNK